MPADPAPLLREEAMRQALRHIAAWPGYEPTPLRTLQGFAQRHDVGAVLYKDEAERFGLGSFKALGGAYAVFRLLQELAAREAGVPDAGYAQLRSGALSVLARRLTVCCATDGNHGRAVAWAAREFGCECVVFLHARVSLARERAIARYGARIERVSGNYDDSVEAAARAAERNGWHLVSDTSSAGDVEIPLDVMTGYTVLVHEVLAQLPDARLPTHVFVQAGVGGLAAAVAAALWRRIGPRMPFLVIVEPERADCLLRSARAGSLQKVEGELDTVMAGLACGEVSPVAWPIIERCASHFLTIPDDRAIETLRALADGAYGDPPIVAGESGVAGLAALEAVARDSEARSALELTRDSRVLVFGTEGDTDPELFEAITGRTAAEIRSHRLPV